MQNEGAVSDKRKCVWENLKYAKIHEKHVLSCFYFSPAEEEDEWLIF